MLRQRGDNQKFIQKLQFCSPQLHFINFCHYISRKIEYKINNDSNYPRIVVKYIPWEI